MTHKTYDAGDYLLTVEQHVPKGRARVKLAHKMSGDELILLDYQVVEIAQALDFAMFENGIGQPRSQGGATANDRPVTDANTFGAAHDGADDVI